MEKMKPEIKAEWISRLRSGKYRQGDGQLKKIEKFDSVTEVRHCCLGVLCEMAVEAGVDIKVHTPEGWNGTVWFGDDNYELPPNEVIEWAGIPDKYGSLPEAEDGWYPHDEEKYESLSDMNDRGLTFEQIADVIEKEY